MTAYALRAARGEELSRLMGRLEMFKLMEKLGVEQALPTPALDANPEAPAKRAEAASPTQVLESIRTLGKGGVLLLRRKRAGAVGPGRRRGRVLAAAFEPGSGDFDRLLELLADPGVEKRTHDSKALAAPAAEAGTARPPVSVWTPPWRPICSIPWLPATS